jgi:hypothetical protein
MQQVARNAAHKVRPGGTLLFMGGTGGLHRGGYRSEAARRKSTRLVSS